MNNMFQKANLAVGYTESVGFPEGSNPVPISFPSVPGSEKVHYYHETMHRVLLVPAM